MSSAPLQKAPPEDLAGAEETLARQSVRIENALFEAKLAARSRLRVEAELRAVERRAAELEADRNALHRRVDEMNRYIHAVDSSRAWRAIQFFRGLVGRRW